MATKVQICNMALTHLGVKNITALTDTTEQARKCDQLFDPMRDEVLRAHEWHFATKVEALALIEDEESPGWEYVYTYPARCLYLRGLLTEDGEPASPERFEEVLATGNVRGLACDLEDAWARYTYQVQDPALFDPVFTAALAYKLAAETAVALTGKPDLKQLMEQAYLRKLEEAKRSNRSEVGQQQKTTSSFEDARA
jgi:hypothetical protein